MDYSVKTKAKLVLGCMISWLIFASSALIIFFMVYSGIMTGGYSFAWKKYLNEKTYEDAMEVMGTYCWDYYNSKKNNYKFDYNYYDREYSPENSNFRFTCVSNGEDNLPGYYYADEKKQFTKTYDLQLYIDYGSDNKFYYFNSYDEKEEFLKTIEGTVSSYEVSEEIDDDGSSGYYVTVYNSNSEMINITMQVYIPSNISAMDEYYYISTCYSILDDFKLLFVFAAIVSAFFLVFFNVKLINRAGRKNGSDVIVENSMDKVPYDIFTILVLGTSVAICLFMVKIAFKSPDNLLYLIGYLFNIFLCLSIMGLLLLEFVYSTVVRVKKGNIFSHTLICMIGSGIASGCRKIGTAIKNVKSYKKAAIAFGIFDLILTVLAVFMTIYDSYYDIMIIYFIIFAVVMIGLVIFEACVVYSIYLLQTSCEKIADGDFEHKIDDKHILKSFNGVAESINKIGDGMDKALKDKIKSEHFKTELITNVSHDIKTPLTSIITYVNLLQNSKVSGEEATEYLDVLERQSGKLKKLIEDLVEASKASTGNLKLEYSVMDIGILTEQAVGEYEEKLRAMNLQVVFDKKNDNNHIKADGRYLWRVIDNLMSNICKYSLENTRVYITMDKTDDNKCELTFKNISKYEIKLSSEELTERFVRGDKSRNTEGSGLGLSIARNLTEAMGGKFFVEVDGDLYKAVLVFDAIEEPPSIDEV
ncbi:MAG: sensor histidine kinase [Lachnospiraceae bacterium]